jgi:hypothetical protein
MLDQVFQFLPGDSSSRKAAIPSPSTSQIASNFLAILLGSPACVASLLNCNLTLFQSGNKNLTSPATREFFQNKQIK